MPQRWNLLLRRLLLTATLAVNLWAMYAPAVPGPASNLRLDLLGHTASFASLTFAGLLAELPQRLVLPLAVLNAVARELIQHYFLPQRTGDLADLAADAVGIALGWCVWRTTDRIRQPPRVPPGADRRGPGSSTPQ